MRRTDRQRGSILGVVMILVMVLLATAVIALHSMRSDTGAAGNDRLLRNLFDCAEEGLAVGKQYFSPAIVYSQWPNYFKTNVCATSYFPCPPFPAGQTGTPPTNYPSGPPFTNTIQVNNQTMTYHFGIYNNPEAGGPTVDTDFSAIIYSQCSDPGTGVSRSVQALIKVSSSTPAGVGDYLGQTGGSFRNTGNRNQ